MPKVSKIRPKGNGYTNGAPPPAKKSGPYLCTRCGREHTRQKGLFPYSYSPLFRENNGFVPICTVCLDELLERYKGRFPSEADAVRRLCMICDLYWNRALYETIKKNEQDGQAGLSVIRTYISKLNLSRYNGKTFDDTLDEEHLAAMNIPVPEKPEKPKAEETPAKKEKKSVTLPGGAPKPSTETILFWGSGLAPEIYQELNLRYQRWTRNLPKPLDDGTEGLYKQLCLAEVNVVQNMAAGKNIESSQKVINDIMARLNITPEQQVEEDDTLGIETTPMGVWIRRWEDKRPLPDEDEDMKDSAGIIRYINTWFLGHIGRMLGIKNIYTKMYDDEIARYRIERPEIADEEDDDFIVDLFGENDGDAE